MRVVRGTTARFAVAAQARGTVLVGALAADGSHGAVARAAFAPARNKQTRRGKK